MVQICPHCRHIRKPTETAPEWQCPACQRAYQKGPGGPASAAPARPVAVGRNPAERSGIGKWLLIALIAGGVFAWLKPGAVSSVSPPRKSQPEVTLYATTWCGYCAATRQLFDANGIEYTEHDIERSTEAATTHRRLGGVGVPLIVVGDTVFKGYNPQELHAELRPWFRQP